MVRRKTWVAALLVLAATSAAGQQNTIRVEFRDGSRRPTEVGVFRTRGVLYASLTDLTEILSLNHYENREARKLEIKAPPYRIKVTGDNPFVVVTDAQRRQNVYQLPYPVINAAGAFFVPLEVFVPYLGPLFGSTATFGEGILAIGSAPPSSTFDIPTVRFEPKTNGLVIRIPATKRLTEMESWLRPDGWLYLTIADARADTAAINALPPTGIVREVIAFQSPTSVQLTFRTRGKIASSEILQDSTDILIALRMSDEVGTAQTAEPASAPAMAPATVQDSATAAEPTPREPVTLRDTRADLESRRRRWELDVIVIDAGHGGMDPGTIGVSGLKEKTVTLGVALKLGKALKRGMKDVRVVFTRDNDTFVPLYRRGQIANEVGGKLFISIHANSLKQKPSRTEGFEVYLLRPGRTEEAIAIAEQENAVIRLEEGYEERYQELTDENFILVTMAQSSYGKASEGFADLVQRHMSATGIRNRGVKQAGFLVLVGAAMPNVLIETGYVSNRNEEKFLKSDAGQQKIADAIYRAIKQYREEYQKLLREGTGSPQE
jgi:N-acetylmuramoyl-L-alanine amidase